jgi:3-oxoacyl-[acyl-carrier-protein] synthase III
MLIGGCMQRDFVLDITAQGAWNGGTRVDNSIYENKGMQFKGGIPVTRETIEERIGVRTRMAAPEGVRIGVAAFNDLLSTAGIDPSRIRVLIAATNVGEDKHDPGPSSRGLHDIVRSACPQALVFDLYAGCPGFNIAVESLFHLSLAGELRPGDLSVVVGAENPHRAKVFKPLDTANIIFGDDALATALETGDGAGAAAPGRTVATAEVDIDRRGDIPAALAEALLPWAREGRWDGLIVDNQLGRIEFRVPATAARAQHALMERLHPKEAAAGALQNFRAAYEIYEGYGAGFAFDVMTSPADPLTVQRLACAYAAGGPYRRLAAVFLPREGPVRLSLIEGGPDRAPPPRKGVLGALTRTHGCFAGFIEAQQDADGLFGRLDGKGVFLYATRGARAHLAELLAAHSVSLDDVELLIEHQANFAMLPLTLEQVFGNREQAARFLAERMVTNIHERGNCSVVCMQRLPYDLARGALRPDEIQGFAVNRNVDRLRQAGLVLYDSVGAGMTRSSFLRRS